MKKESTIIAFLLLFLFACQKDATKQTTANLSNQISSKQITFLRTDTTTHVNNSYSLDTSKIKVHITGLLGPDPVPIMSLGITYAGNGLYNIQPYNNQTGKNYDCDYAIYTAYSGGSTLYKDLGRNNGNELTQAYVGSLPVSSYYLQVTYFSGPLSGGVDPTEKEQFAIYAQPAVPTGMACLLRYFNNTTGQHICTSNWEELGSYSEGFEYEKVLGYMYPNATQGSNLQYLYRYYDATTGTHFETNIYADYSSYVYEGILGCVGITSSGTLINPVDEWYDATSNDHFNCVPPEVPNGTAYTKGINFVCGYVQ